MACLAGAVVTRAQDSEQRVFPTPQAAVDALIAAAKSPDPKTALRPVLGPDADKISTSGDAVADATAIKKFLSRYDEMHRLAYDADRRVIMYIGADNWPTPIPLVKKDGGWVWDTPAGEQELVYRRIGGNELFTIGVLENLVEAQNEYAEGVKSQTGKTQFAQKILSDEGQHNGLYWPTEPGGTESPIGPLIANAVTEGYKRGTQGEPKPFHGYLYKVLTGQGKDAPGGAKSYLRDGRMTGGFAFLAYPASYRASGVTTFIVGQDGIVLEKDLGPETADLAQKITVFDPDKSWIEAAPDEVEPQLTPAEDAESSLRLRWTPSRAWD